MPGSKKSKKGAKPARAKIEKLDANQFEAFARAENLRNDHLIADTVYEVKGKVKKREKAVAGLAKWALKFANGRAEPIVQFEVHALPKFINGEGGRSVVYFTAPKSAGQEVLNAATEVIAQDAYAKAKDLKIIRPPKSGN